NAMQPRLVAGGRHDAARPKPAHHDRPSSQAGLVELLDRRIKGVHVEVKDAWLVPHGRHAAWISRRHPGASGAMGFRQRLAGLVVQLDVLLTHGVDATEVAQRYRVLLHPVSLERMVLQNGHSGVQRALEDLLTKLMETAELLQTSQTFDVPERDVMRYVITHKDLEDRVLKDRQRADSPHCLDRLVAEALMFGRVADDVDRLVGAVK